VFVTVDSNWPFGLELSLETQSGLLHDSARSDVHGHRCCMHATSALPLKGDVDQRLRAFGGESLTPRPAVESIAEFWFIERVAFAGA
jgi:hypothetical protein